jgi:hypothetical protein
MNYSKWAGIVAAAFAMHTSLAAAGTITQTVSFTATDFVGHGGPPTPVDPVKGTFTFTIDPTLDYTNEMAGISASQLNITLGFDTLAFDFDSSTHNITIGGALIGACCFQESWNDFALRFNIDNLAAGGYFSYSQFPVVDHYDAHSLVLQQGAFATTPLPPSLVMLSTGLLALGVMGWRREPA